MREEIANVQQAKESFNRVLANQTYAGIIRDDKHLEVILNLVKDGNYRRILDIGTGTGYLAFPLAEMYPEAKVFGIDITGTPNQGKTGKAHHPFLHLHFLLSNPLVNVNLVLISLQ